MNFNCTPPHEVQTCHVTRKEPIQNEQSYPCCDVCELSSTTGDYSCEVKATVHDLPDSGKRYAKSSNMLIHSYFLAAYIIYTL